METEEEEELVVKEEEPIINLIVMLSAHNWHDNINLVQQRQDGRDSMSMVVDLDLPLVPCLLPNNIIIDKETKTEMVTEEDITTTAIVHIVIVMVMRGVMGPTEKLKKQKQIVIIIIVITNTIVQAVITTIETVEVGVRVVIGVVVIGGGDTVDLDHQDPIIIAAEIEMMMKMPGAVDKREIMSGRVAREKVCGKD